MRRVVQLVLCLHLLAPIAARAQAGPSDSPLNYSLKEYGFMLGFSMLGGAVGWYAKVRKGDHAAMSIYAFMGELMTSAFSGLLAFLGCKYLNLSPALTAAIVGVAGHMGTRAINAAEALLQSRIDRMKGQP